MTLLKLLGPLAISVLIVVGARRRGYGGQLGLVPPPVGRTAIWLACWLGWIAVTELARAWLGMPAPDPWPDYPTTIVVLRIAAIGIVGPVFEELVFRGVLLARLSPTRLGPTLSIVAIAAGFAAFHVGNQSPPELVFTFVDAVLFGLARRHTGSLVAPCLMHATGNLFSIGQSLGAW